MLNTFVSSQVTRWGTARLGVASLSVLAHASLITIAVVESGHASADAGLAAAAAPLEHLQYLNVRELTASRAKLSKSAFAHAVKRAPRLLVPDMTKLHAVADLSLTAMPKVPDVKVDEDLSSHITGANDFGKVDTQQLVDASPYWALSHPGREGAYSEDDVEKAAWPREDNPRPRYPDALKDAGIEGSFLVQFVVDSTGRVDPKTLSFPKATHPAFLRAVRDALLRSRYIPAELAGIRVRQLVQQQFTFVIAR